ncbi:hypothetical protein Fmac_027063 [Flemingia macrophylla]|uniref:beta-galactosidase n=1 Tax=Flemingia macrophylla TaxID=520843 RepID=A0ABD1LGP3_9FABA
MAVAQNIGVPWIMCQQHDAPQPMINTCNGYYCDNFQPNNPKSPKMFTENWIGWFQKWGERVPHRSAEDSAFSVARFFQNGGLLNNYYMYHGGTNFGRTAGGPYITTSYDYDAPLDEYGNLNQPKWGHLKQLHAAIKLGEKILTNGTRSDNNADASVDLKQDGKYFLPAWSVTILDGCTKEVFNTAKVNSQTSVMVKKSDDPSVKLTWAWAPERKKDTLRGKGNVDANQLLEQKELTLDASDYLWRYAGYKFSQWGSKFTYEKQVSLKQGTNIIALLSATVGLPNYGTGFDKIKTGIAGGPVQLIGKNNVTMDLSTNLWSYKIGLNGERKRLYDLQPQIGVSWHANSSYPISKPMTWYKADFEAPYGTNPVVVDLQGLGKGHAWVNGHSIGRYWPSWITASNGCKSFLNKDKNTLVLFEETERKPSKRFLPNSHNRTVCALVYEGALLELSCQGGQVISQIQFASFGNPKGKCGSFEQGSWEAIDSRSVIEAACIGRSSCEFLVTKEAFSVAGANNGPARLAVQATC